MNFESRQLILFELNLFDFWQNKFLFKVGLTLPPILEWFFCEHIKFDLHVTLAAIDVWKQFRFQGFELHLMSLIFLHFALLSFCLLH